MARRLISFPKMQSMFVEQFVKMWKPVSFVASLADGGWVRWMPKRSKVLFGEVGQESFPPDHMA